MLIKPTNIAKYFQKLSIEDLQRIPDVGPTVAESIYNWFRDKHNLALLEKLEASEIKIEVPKFNASSLKLQGKTFVLTGEMELLSREQAKERIRELGGDVSSSVSKNTDFTVVGKNPGSKYDKAITLGVKVIREKDFLKMLE